MGVSENDSYITPARNKGTVWTVRFCTHYRHFSPWGMYLGYLAGVPMWGTYLGYLGHIPFCDYKSPEPLHLRLGV